MLAPVISSLDEIYCMKKWRVAGKKNQRQEGKNQKRLNNLHPWNIHMAVYASNLCWHYAYTEEFQHFYFFYYNSIQLFYEQTSDAGNNISVGDW